MAKKAIILGITGLTGGILAQQLFKDADYDTVISFHRRKSGLQHPKLTEHIIDLQKLNESAAAFDADVVYCCIGTTQAKTPDKQKYKAIDYAIPVAAASLCAHLGIPIFVAISAMGANPNSSFFYNRIKGEMEGDILKMGIARPYFLQPALIAGDRKEARPAEKIAITAFRVINPLLMGPLKKYRSIKPETIAKAMREVAQKGYAKNRIPSDEIKEIAEE